MAYITQVNAPTTSSIAWGIFVKDDFIIPRIVISFDSAPVSAGDITISVDSIKGSTYDYQIYESDPRGKMSVIVAGLVGFSNGDVVIVEYANPDGVSVTGVATIEVTPNKYIFEGLRVDRGIIYSEESQYRRYYHIPIESADPGASGATWHDADTNELGGWLLDTPTERVADHVDLHSDWDGISNPVFDILFTIQSDNTSGTDSDTIDFEVEVFYTQPGMSLRYQTINVSKVVGKAALYDTFKLDIEIDRDSPGAALEHGDSMNVRLSILGTGTLTEAIINSLSFYYSTTHIGLQASDV